jgi:endonuclease G
MFDPQSQLPLRRTRSRKTRRPALVRTWRVVAFVTAVTLLAVYVAFAAISLSTSIPYTQNFTSMGIPLSNPAPSNLPADFRQDTIAAVRTLGSFSASSTQTARVGGANVSTTAANGSYNFGAGTTTLGDADRAAGFISSGTATMSGNLYAQFLNNTGSTLSGLLISYDVEKYRNGSNPAGFRYQLFYSLDGNSWTNAGPDFLTSFPADANNNGFATAPGATASVTNKTVSVSVANGANVYLAWNYSVVSGTTTTNAQALAIDNVSVLGLGAGGSTNPSGVGTANPNSVAATQSTLLTVAVTPGQSPTSTTHTVATDLTAIGGSASQQFFDDGTNGDVTAGDNTFSFTATVAMGTTGGIKSLPFTITETSPLSRTGTGTISLGVLGATDPSGAGAANPNSVLPGEVSTLTVTVTPGANPTSTGLAVSADLSSIGGSANQQFFDDGVNGGDAVAGNNVFTYVATVAPLTTAGLKSLPFTITDTQARSAGGSISLTVQQPPPPVDHLVISQLYGGGGNSGATLTNDYIEIYNPTGISFNLAGWSLQYASAAGTSWTNKQPLGGTIAPGEYFLVQLASGGANGSPLPVSANISGDINMSATTGKIALVSNSISLSGSCPNGTDPDIVDFVGYGSSASCFEGAARAPAPSNTNALFRKLNGAQDTNQNGTDFQTGAPNPRRTAPIVELGPWVAGTEPISDGFNVPYDATVTVDFSEPVDVDGNWFDITCANSGQHNSATIASYNSSKGFHITPNTGFQFGEQCTVTFFHANVHDQDLDDASPNTDTLFADHSWSFTVVAAGAPAPHPPSVHLAFGNPSNAVADLQQGNNYLMEKPSFSLSYNKDKGTPNWVSWHLENDWTGNLPRTDTFRADPAVSPDWYRVQSTDYFASGFDRGHMTPNADRDNPASIPLNQETFLMSNMVPQAPNNNQGPWADLENFLRTLLPANEVYIVAGPAGVGGSGDNGPANTIANGHVTVPAYTWKVAVVLPLGDNDVSRVNAATRTIAVIMPNQNSINSDWHTYLTTVDAVEALTGYDFFANVPDIVENSIEAGVNGDNPPGTDNQFATTAEDVPADIMLNAVSPALSPTFTYTIVTPPANGVLSGSGPSFTYTPAQDFHGSDSFTFRVNDGSHDSNVSSVSITVTEVNDSPVANDDTASADEDSHVDVSAADLASNDSSGPANESLQSLNVTAVFATANTHGSVVLANGVVTYTPDANFNGPAGFEYQVCDNGNTNGLPDSKCATGVVNVTVNPVNDAPAANSQSVSTNSNTPVGITVTGSDLETAADNLVFEVTVSPAHGSLSGTGANLTYTPNMNYGGPDSFQFTVRDSGDGSAPALTSAAATVSITVNDTVAPAIHAPANVTVNTGAGATACSALVTEGQLGTATATDNAGSVSIQRSGVPAGNIFPVGTTTITYTATDDAGNSASATQTVTVIDNTAPTITAPAPTSVNADSTGHATIPNVVAGTTASDNCGPVTVTQSPLAGTVVGTGTHTITITATDAAGNTNTATTTFTVNGAADSLAFSVNISPTTIEQNRQARLDIAYTNTNTSRVSVTFVVRYTNPCGSFVLDTTGPSSVNAGQDKSTNVQFHAAKDACIGAYTFTVEAYLNGVFVGTRSADLTVIPDPTRSGPGRKH